LLVDLGWENGSVQTLISLNITSMGSEEMGLQLAKCVALKNLSARSSCIDGGPIHRYANLTTKCLTSL